MYTIHVPRSHLLRLVPAHQHLLAHVEPPAQVLQLLVGLFVLVPHTYRSSNSPTSSRALTYSIAYAAAAVPWRLRQIAAVKAQPCADPADVVLELVGGGSVLAGAVKEGLLDDGEEGEVRPWH